MAFDGELIAGQHNPATRAAIRETRYVADKGSAGATSYVSRYFDSVANAETAAATLAAEAATGNEHDVRFEVIRARCSHP